MKLWTKEYSILEEDDFFFIFKEWLFLGRFSFTGEYVFPGYESITEAENRVEELKNPKNVELL